MTDPADYLSHRIATLPDRYRAYVKMDYRTYVKDFPLDTDLESMMLWRMAMGVDKAYRLAHFNKYGAQ